MWTESLIIPVCMDKTSHYLTGITVLCEIGTSWALLLPINALEQFDWQVLQEGGLCIVYSGGLDIRRCFNQTVVIKNKKYALLVKFHRPEKNGVHARTAL